MKLSLIITTYNSPEQLEKVLDAVQAQRHLPDEVIIADDGSGGETRERVQTFEGRYPKSVSYMWQEDQGFRAARIRNLAIHQSTGAYIVLLDGDCVPSQHFVEDHLALAERGHFFQGKRVLVSQKRSPTFSCTLANSFKHLAGALIRGDLSHVHHLIRLPAFPARRSRSLDGIKSCNMGFFRDDIVAVNGFNEDFVGWGREDSELVVRFYRYGLWRKDHPFMAQCFHLWHPELDRGSLSTNDHLLKKAMASHEFFCKNGLDQHQGSPF